MKTAAISGATNLPSKRQYLLLTAAAFVGALNAPDAFAQSTPPASAAAAVNTGTVETVVVTAQKRSEKLKDVPQSVSALTQSYLTAIGADSLETFANTVPGLQMQTFAPGQTRITIRGISPDEQTGVTAVSYYLDEIPIAAADQRSQPEVWLYDVDRVEVLRGPQGTLWGEGAMGGTIHIITSKPDTSSFQGSLLGNVYSIDNGGTGYKADAMINLPIVEGMLAVRLVYEHRDDAGWIDDILKVIPNPFLPPPDRYVTSAVIKDSNRAINDSLRGQLRFTPTSRLTIDAEFINNNISVHSSSYGDVSAYTNIDLGLRPSTDVADLYNVTASYAFDEFTVTSASSYSERRTFRSLFQEPLLLGSPFVTAFFETQHNNTKVFTQEVRAVSDADQPFRWTAGFFYQNAVAGGPTVGTIDAPAFGLKNFPLFTLNGDSDYNTYAFFGQAEYDILPNLTLIGGGRWFHESQSLGPTPPPGLHRKADGFTPLASLKYKFTDDWMAYATYSEGYRSGGFNQFAGPPTYAPDTTKNYEIGTKYVSADNKLSLDAAAYYIQWSDMQYTQLSSGGFFTFVGNANKASSRGIEFTGEYHWDNGLWAQLNADWTDAHLDAAVPLTIGFLGGVASSGTPLPSVPPYKVSATAGYNTNIFGDYLLAITGVVSFVGSQHTKLEEGAVFVDPLFGNHYTIGAYLHPYSSGNLRAEVSKDNWSLALYLNNIWNNTKPIGDDNFLAVNGYAGGQPFYYMRPRTIGLEAAIHL